MKKLLSFALLILTSHSVSATLITNGSFENGLTGWDSTPFSGGHIFVSGSEGKTEGTKSVIFNGGNLLGGTLSQSFETTVGKTYQLNFDFGVFGAANLHELQIELFGNSTFVNQAIQKVGPGSFSANETNFSSYSYEFIADSSNANIRFTNFTTLTNSISSDSLVDNVSISSVPVPTAVWLFGSGLLGLVGMKKKLS